MTTDGEALMRRRDISKVLLSSAAASALLVQRSEAQSCVAPCYPATAVESGVGVTPSDTSFPPLDVRRYGYLANNASGSAASNTAALNTAINIAAATVGGAIGATVTLPIGIGYINQTIVLPNRVRLRGQNCSGTIIKAHSAFTGSSMFHAHNGTISMFDSILEDLCIDCSDVTGLGGILSDAWQENSGLRSVIVMGFRTYGVRFQNGYGGASTCELARVQLFASSLGALAGIRVDQISSVGAFLLHIHDSIIAYGAAVIPRGIDVVKDSLLLNNVHFEGCTDCVYLAGVGSLTAANVSGGPDTTTLFHIDSAFTGRIALNGSFRNGATYFVNNEANGDLFSSPDMAAYVWPNVHASNTAKAWCVFNGTSAGTNAPIRGFNVASVTRNGVGDYRINFVRPLTSVFAAPMTSSNLASAGTHISTTLINTVRIDVGLYVSGVRADANEVKVVVFGD